MPGQLHEQRPVDSFVRGRLEQGIEGARPEVDLEPARPVDEAETQADEGVAKIDVGRRQLFWIWTRPLVDWLRLQLWSWWP